LQELAAAEGFDLERSTAYSDSYSDVPFLESVGHPVAANPDRKLRRIADERGWPVVRFAS
jgi:phosphoserine phosphatase